MEEDKRTQERINTIHTRQNKLIDHVLKENTLYVPLKRNTRGEDGSIAKRGRLRTVMLDWIFNPTEKINSKC